MDGFFGIDNGKTFNIKLKGITISAIQGKLTVKSTQIELPALPIGLRRPVALPIGLMNIGSGPLKYSLDLASLATSHPNLIETQTVTFQNETNNIGVFKKVNFVILFRPVCSIPIVFPLHINVFDYFKQIQKISLQVTAYPATTFDQAALDTFFKVDDDLASMEGIIKEMDQGCYLSDDLLDFRMSRLHSKNERVIFLTNMGAKDSIHFWFDGLELSKSKRIVAAPDHGTIGPKGTTMVTFIYEQNDHPMFWEGELSVSVRTLGSGDEDSAISRAVSKALSNSDELGPPIRRLITNPEVLEIQNRQKEKRIFLRVKISTDLTVR